MKLNPRIFTQMFLDGENKLMGLANDGTLWRYSEDNDWSYFGFAPQVEKPELDEVYRGELPEYSSFE